MVAKKVSIGMKPQKAEEPANLEQWISTRPSVEETPVPVPPPAEAAPVKMKRLTLDIPEPLHKAIKSRSVQDGVAMVDMLRTLLEEHYGNK
jgi:predicted DNA binding CopG/RHH family protein